MKTIVLFFLFSIPFVSYSQTAKELNVLAEKHIESEPQKAYNLLEKALLKTSKNDTLTERIQLNIAIVNRIQGDYKTALEKSFSILKSTSSNLIKASAYNNVGACYKRTGKYEKAIEYYIKALTIYLKNNRLSDAATLENNIGLVLQEIEELERAEKYHISALNHFIAVNDQLGISKSHNMLGIIYASQENLEKALSSFKKSLSINRKEKNKIGISESLNNIGGIFFYLGELDSALTYFKESLELDRISNDYSSLTDSYNNLAEVYLNVNEYTKMNLYIDSAYYLAKKHKYAHGFLYALENYSLLYEMKADYKKANEYLHQYAIAKDSVEAISNRKNLDELEQKYQTEKKERILLEKEIQLKKKTQFITTMWIVLSGLIVITWLIVRTLRLKNKQQKQEFELKTAIATIDTQNKLQEQRLSISRDLHDNIGAQLTFVISSIDTLKYAFKITDEKINQKLTSISTFTKETITELRDTIWAMNHSEIDLEEIQGRISNFVEKAKLAKETIDFKFVKEGDLQNIQFTSLQGMNIYRIIQEAINNALKYADASSIEIHVSGERNHVRFAIQDNGKGFDQTTVDLGNGLRNMKKRADDIQAKFDIHSTVGKGTLVSLTIDF
jgi:signal transduction histidine kinase